MSSPLHIEDGIQNVLSNPGFFRPVLGRILANGHAVGDIEKNWV